MTSPKVKLQEIALEAGVMVSDVLKVALKQKMVDEDVQNRILIAMRNHNYGNNTGATTKTIAVISAGTFASGDYITGVLQGIYEQAVAQGYTLQLGASNLTENFIEPLFADRTLQGVIMLVPKSFDQAIAECNKHHKPYILIDYEGEHDISSTPLVMVNNRDAMYQMTTHLIALGHQRIGFITGMPSIHAAQERYYGYLDALEDHQIEYDQSLVIEGTWLKPSGYLGAKTLLEMRHRPTAIMASNDLMAYGVVEVANELGLIVGDDLSVTGFDDLSFSQSMTPALTTIRQPMNQIGKKACEMLQNILKGIQPDPIHALLEVELVIRDSTHRPRR